MSLKTLSSNYPSSSSSCFWNFNQKQYVVYFPLLPDESGDNHIIILTQFEFPNNPLLSSRTNTKVLFLMSSQNKPLMSPSWFSSALTWLPWWWKQMIKVKKKWTSSTKSTCFLLPFSPGSASSKCWLCDTTTSPMAGTSLTLSSWFCLS